MKNQLSVTLALDASTYSGSVAILRGSELAVERVLAETAQPVRGTREEGMMPAIADCLRTVDMKPGDLDRIVCGGGPGSFTSLRIAASLAKGLAHSLEIPLYAVSSLKLLAAGAEQGASRVVAAINAMRGEWFVAEFDLASSSVIDAGPPTIVVDSALAEFAAARNAALIRAEPGGAGPRAASVARFLDSVVSGSSVDLQSWEPTYGRLAEAQVRWEKASGKSLPA